MEMTSSMVTLRRPSELWLQTAPCKFEGAGMEGEEIYTIHYTT